MSSGNPQIQAALDAAQRPIREAAAVAIDQAASALKSLAGAAPQRERGSLVQAQAQLLQQRQPLLAAFEKALRDAVDEELSPQGEDSAFGAPTDWKAIGLVDENEVEERLAFERVGQFISHECEAELRELSAYTGEMLDLGWADPARNPLRGNVIGAALNQAIESITKESEMRRVLVKELGQAMAKTLPTSYRGIIDDLSARGFRQADLTVRSSPSSSGNGVGSSGPAGAAGAAGSPGFEAMRDLWEKSMVGRMPMGGAADMARAWEASIRPGGVPGGYMPGHGGAYAPEQPGNEHAAALLERLMQGGAPSDGWPGAAGGGPSGGGGISDADLMQLLRRLNGGGAGAGAARSTMFEGLELPGTAFASTASGGALPTRLGGIGGGGSGIATNLIRAHHDELVQASTGQLDHMVIEVVASLFDQILADARVPPQIAREIARLQLPVLRVAMRDTTFFSSRKHAVRRFINRISTLASSFDELDDGPGKELVGRVNALVTEIVDGDFDQIALYAKKLTELEQFTSALGRAEFERSPAAAALRVKEAEWKYEQRFSGRLHEALEPLAVTGYLKTFLVEVWSRAIIAAAQGDGSDPAREKRYRRAAFHLVASVQPKRSIEQRNEFISGLAGLMATLNEGLALIGWPKAEHDAFFAKLMADHAGSLKAAPSSELDHNMLMRQLDALTRTPLPAPVDASAADAPAEVTAAAFEPRFSAKEAERIGLVDDASVDWSKPALADSKRLDGPDVATNAAAGEPCVELDLDLATRPAPLDPLPVVEEPIDPDALPTISLLPQAPAAVASPRPASAEAEEPTEGPALIHHLQMGSSYRLQLKDQWEKVRLTYMNPGRTFFLFAHGSQDRGTISMTARMLGRLCEARRLKTFEDSPLIERATERVRLQAALPQAAPTATRAAELSTA